MAEILRVRNIPIISQFDLFHCLWSLYQRSDRGALYLREAHPNRAAYRRLRENLTQNGMVRGDADYGGPVMRILDVPDLPADQIACLADRTAYISHLSAMQRWGLTDRNPKALMLTRPTRANARAQLERCRTDELDPEEDNPFSLQYVTHPTTVRRRPLAVFTTRHPGAYVAVRGEHARIATMGQTFLDMVTEPERCGGMPYVVDVWIQHAGSYLAEIVEAIDESGTTIAKSRAGYLLEERLGFTDAKLTDWKRLGTRGGSRKLDPSEPFSPTFSETWMLSINV